MNTYIVTIPIAGHISFEVEAETKQQAEEIAKEEDPANGELTWETLDRFNEGNVCYCPSPQEIQVKQI